MTCFPIHHPLTPLFKTEKLSGFVWMGHLQRLLKFIRFNNKNKKTMCVCVYLYVHTYCVYLCTHIYTHCICIYTHIHTSMYIYICTFLELIFTCYNVPPEYVSAIFISNSVATEVIIR